jgi:uncharacterized surface protein with fasciclin (FAS1) repeats
MTSSKSFNSAFLLLAISLTPYVSADGIRATANRLRTFDPATYIASSVASALLDYDKMLKFVGDDHDAALEELATVETNVDEELELEKEQVDAFIESIESIMIVDGMSMPPSLGPNTAPSYAPATGPSNRPSTMPSFLRTSMTPSVAPTSGPSYKPSDSPTAAPTPIPTKAPSSTGFPFSSPFVTVMPSLSPSSKLSATPSVTPPVALSTAAPSVGTQTPSADPSAGPTSPQALSFPMAFVSFSPTRFPNVFTTSSPMDGPTIVPSSSPSGEQEKEAGELEKKKKKEEEEPLSSPSTRQPTPTPTSSPTTASRQTITQLVSSNPDTSILFAALERANFADALDQPNYSFALFAPTNNGFGLIPAELVDLLLTEDEFIFHLRKLLLYHLLPGARMASEFPNATIIQTLNPERVGILQSPFRVNSIPIVSPDNLAFNGIVQTIAGVLAPHGS